MKSSIALKFSCLLREYKEQNQVTISGELEDYVYPYLKSGKRDEEILYILKKLPPHEKMLFANILSICDELRINHIDSPEILNNDNWGIKPNKKLALFDIGFGDWFQAFDNPPQELNLDEATKQNVQKFTDIAQKVAQKLNLTDLKYLGAGNFGYAFEVNGNMVLKITSDHTEAINSNKILGKKLNYIADIYKIFTFNLDKKVYYVILLEKLDRSTISKTNRIYKSLKNWFNKLRNMHYDSGIIGVIGNKHPMVAEFLGDIVNMGYTIAWQKWADKLRGDKTYDWNDISELAEWIKGSKTNTHDISERPPEWVQDAMSVLIK
jgi:hypothetical protein